MSIAVLLVDDHQLVREGLHLILEREGDIRVVAEADSGKVAVELAKRHRPDVVVMDIEMPGLNGIEATRRIRLTEPGVKVVALSMHTDSRYVAAMLDAGADGYLLKDCAGEELATAIRTVSEGATYLSPHVAAKLVRPVGVPVELTTREREVLQHLTSGAPTRRVAEDLKISEKTVQSHRQHIMKKLRIRSLAELTKYAVREGIASLDD